MSHYRYLHKRTFINDLIWLVIFNAAMFAIFASFDTLEWIYQVSRKYEYLELDELVPLGASVATSLLVFSYRRIVEISKITQAFEELSMRDPLTNTLNRRSGQLLLNSWHTEAVTSNRFYSMIMLDIESLKRINDLYGTNIGDEILLHCAEFLEKTLPNDAKLIRWIDSRFLILLPPSIDNPYLLSNNILDSLAKDVFTLTDPVICNAGVAVYRKNCTIEDMLDDVDNEIAKSAYSNDATMKVC